MSRIIAPGAWRAFLPSLAVLLLVSLLAGVITESRQQTVYRASAILDAPLRQAAACNGADCSLQSGDGLAWFLVFVEVAQDAAVHESFARQAGAADPDAIWPSVYHNAARQRAQVVVRGDDRAALPGRLNDYLAHVVSRANRTIAGQVVDCAVLDDACQPDGGVSAAAFYRASPVIVERISPKPGLRLLLALLSGWMVWLAWVTLRLSMAG